MELEENERAVIESLAQLAGCLHPYDKRWSEALKQDSIQAHDLFSHKADLNSKYAFVSSHQYYTGGMGSLNDGVVPGDCEHLKNKLYNSIKNLLRAYRKELGYEWHDYLKFDKIPDGTKVKLVPNKIILIDPANNLSLKVPDTEEITEQIWEVLECNGPDISNMPSYLIRCIKGGTSWRSARHEALEIL